MSSSVVRNEGMLRPGHMVLIQMYMPAEVAQGTLAELGEVGLCQFRDVLLEYLHHDSSMKAFRLSNETTPLRCVV